MAEGHGSSTKAILYALVANSGIAVAKTAAAIYTRSGSMLAEAIHSYADCANQLLLLLGLRQSKKPATVEHPLGYGKATYFWSFMVAIMLFSMGGLFSIYEGFHKLKEPAGLHQAWVGLVVLGFSIGLEWVSMWGCMREINKIRGDKDLWTWLKQSRNAELVVVFGEDLAALLGLIVAFCFLGMAQLTGNPIYDAYGSIAIGVILLVISVWVALRVKALLLGRSADPDIAAAIEAFIDEDDTILKVYNVITVQFGPQIILAAKVALPDTLALRAGAEKINALEKRLKEKFPEIGYIFMEPDVRA